MNDTVANPEEGAASANQNGADENLSAEEQISNLLPDDEQQKKPSKKASDEGADDKSANPNSGGEDDSSDESESDDESDDLEENEDEDTDDDVADDESGEEPEFKSLDELAEAADMSVEQILAMVKGKVKIKGEEREVTFEEALKGQMLESDYRFKTAELAEDKKLFASDKAEATEVIRANVQEGVNILRALEADYLQIDKGMDWAKLKDEDPHEYTLKKGEASERIAKLNGFRNALKTQHDKLQADQKVKTDAEAVAYDNIQADAIQRLIPSWVDEKVAQKEIGDIRTYLKSSFDGDMAFTDSDVDGMKDARVISLINKARLYDSSKQKADHIKKKVSKTRKISKSQGKPQKKSQSKLAKDKTNKAIKTGNIGDAEAAIFDLL